MAAYGRKNQGLKGKSQLKSVPELTKYLTTLISFFHDVFEEKIDLENDITRYEQIAIVDGKSE